MMKKIYVGIAALILLFASSASAASSDWSLLGGGKVNGEWGAMNVQDVAAGIQLQGNGAYDSAEGSAVGLVLNAAVDADSFEAELQVDKIAGLGSEGADHWFNVNLLDKPSFFSLDHPDKAQGVVVLMRPYDAKQIDVETYLLSPGSGFMGLGATRVDWDGKLRISFSASGEQLTVNGTAIEADLSKLPDGLFADGKAYFSTGASSQGDAEYGYTLLSVNGAQASLEAGLSSATRATGAPASNPKTGDAGLGIYAAIAAASLLALVLASRRAVGKAGQKA
ncbi:hypothetical protein [Cohnella fermenti]|uniref:Uncharacterized protein n=1 Tax=Cohnella fermenti TaxID=2565925 RepID=A0A4S4C9Q3_9BACL|nr:hypothetical protein [Cohnella fermenti]THF84096.1 hypothetical protein E6C55_01960 [Cohnella fermenti]